MSNQIAKAKEYNKLFHGMFLRTVVVGTAHQHLNIPDRSKEMFYKEFGKKSFYKSAEDPLRLDLQTYQGNKNPSVCVSTVRSRTLAWNEDNVVVLMGFSPFDRLYDKDQHSTVDFARPDQRIGKDDDEEPSGLFVHDVDHHDEGWVNYSKAQVVAAAVPDELYKDPETIATLKEYNPKIKIMTLSSFNKLFSGDELVPFLYNLKSNQRFDESTISFERLVLSIL